MAAIAANEKYKIEIHETYRKQTLRNRCVIYGANGALPLAIPVSKPNGSHTQTKDIRISYHCGWQRIHWNSITSAYNSSPYFLFYKDHFEPFYFKKYSFLIDFNTELLLVLLGLTGIKSTLDYTSSFESFPLSCKDLRNEFAGKHSSSAVPQHAYYQVFSDKHGFIGGLSIIDLLFNEGKKTVRYLPGIHLPDS